MTPRSCAASRAFEMATPIRTASASSSRCGAEIFASDKTADSVRPRIRSIVKNGRCSSDSRL